MAVLKTSSILANSQILLEQEERKEFCPKSYYLKPLQATLLKKLKDKDKGGLIKH